MANNANCPAMGDILRGEQCTENLAGLGTIVYVGLKSDLESPMTATQGLMPASAAPLAIVMEAPMSTVV